MNSFLKLVLLNNIIFRGLIPYVQLLKYCVLVENNVQVTFSNQIKL